MRILVITHVANRTGAPIVLLNYLRYLRLNNWGIETVILRSGELNNEFEKLGNVWHLNIKESKFVATLKKVLRIKSLKQQMIERLAGNYDIVYANTVPSLDFAIKLKQINKDIKLICHVHEMEMAIKQYYGADKFKEAIPYITHFIAVSNSVKKNLVQNYQIDNNISIIYESIETQKIIDQGANKDIQASNFSLPFSADGSLIVAGGGTTDWRKGIDLFLQTALYIKEHYPISNIKFVWVGGYEGVDLERARFDISQMELEDIVHITGTVDNPHDYLYTCDLFFLSSREDPFPLIVLEAAALGKPIMCFNKGGGIPEFITKERGWVIDYGNIKSAADIIIMQESANKRVELAKMGENAKTYVKKHFDINVNGATLKNLIEKISKNIDE